MSYAQELAALLRPLGVYTFREGSFSMAQLEALGAALDTAYAALQYALRESVTATAEDEGLAAMEALFRHAPIAATAEQRRAVIAGFLQISGDGFTLQALARCICACGAACELAETGQVNRVRVRFPHIMGIPEGFAQMRTVIEDILPAQVGIEYAFRWCTWGETEDYALLWADVGAMDWLGWMTYHEGVPE